MAMNESFEVIGSYLTPTILFCILNLTILTIFILNSQLKQHQTNFPRVPSLFERVTSFNLSTYQSEPQLVRVPSLLERVKSIKLRAEPKPEEPVYVETTKSETVKLVRVPSLLERVKSIKFLTEPKPEELVHVERTKSETVKKKNVKKVLMKSVSEKLPVEADEATEKLRPATVRQKTTTFNEDEAVDEKADDFINRFRQQLKLQRMDSILRYKNKGADQK